MARSTEHPASSETHMECGRQPILASPSRSFGDELDRLRGDHFGSAVLCCFVGDFDGMTIWGVHYCPSSLYWGVNPFREDSRNGKVNPVVRRVGRRDEPVAAPAVALTVAVTSPIPHRSANRSLDDLPTYLRHPEVCG